MWGDGNQGVKDQSQANTNVVDSGVVEKQKEGNERLHDHDRPRCYISKELQCPLWHGLGSPWQCLDQ